MTKRQYAASAKAPTGKRNVAITVDEVSAPGSQDGLLGMALHPDLLKSGGSDYVYVGYTYVDMHQPVNPAVFNGSEAYKHLYGKIVRLAYHPASGTLSDPVDLITGLPVGNDHVSGRLKIGPDRKLYYTVGDQGHDQLGNFCLPIQAQRLPTAAEIGKKDYAAYVGKSLRLNLDGSGGVRPRNFTTSLLSTTTETLVSAQATVRHHAAALLAPLTLRE